MSEDISGYLLDTLLCPSVLPLALAAALDAQHHAPLGLGPLALGDPCTTLPLWALWWHVEERRVRRQGQQGCCGEGGGGGRRDGVPLEDARRLPKMCAANVWGPLGAQVPLGTRTPGCCLRLSCPGGCADCLQAASVARATPRVACARAGWLRPGRRSSAPATAAPPSWPATIQSPACSGIRKTSWRRMTRVTRRRGPATSAKSRRRQPRGAACASRRATAVGSAARLTSHSVTARASSCGCCAGAWLGWGRDDGRRHAATGGGKAGGAAQ